MLYLSYQVFLTSVSYAHPVFKQNQAECDLVLPCLSVAVVFVVLKQFFSRVRFLSSFTFSKTAKKYLVLCLKLK